MLPAKYRLTKSEDFRRVHSRGRSWANRMLVLCKLARDPGETRFGFSVSRRIGKAVVRNRVKRLLREAVHHRLSEVTPGWDIVVIARQGVAGASFAEVERAVTQLLSTAGLLEGDQTASVGRSG